MGIKFTKNDFFQDCYCHIKNRNIDVKKDTYPPAVINTLYMNEKIYEDI